MQIFVSFQGLFQQLNFLVALNAAALGIGTALPITFVLVKTHHLLDTSLVLLFHAEFEFELGQHKLDLGAEISRVILDKICRVQSQYSYRGIFFNKTTYQACCSLVWLWECWRRVEGRQKERAKA